MYDTNTLYLDDDENTIEMYDSGGIWMTQSYACGSVFSDSVLDFLASAVRMPVCTSVFSVIVNLSSVIRSLISSSLSIPERLLTNSGNFEQPVPGLLLRYRKRKTPGIESVIS